MSLTTVASVHCKNIAECSSHHATISEMKNTDNNSSSVCVFVLRGEMRDVCPGVEV